MSFNNFKPTIHAANLLHEIEQKTVFTQVFNREYEGDAKKLGDQIVFSGLGDPTISTPSTKEGFISAGEVESLEDVSLVMKIEQVKTFYFGIGDIDRELAKQGEGILGKGRKKAAYQISVVIDKYLASLFARKEATKYYAAGSEPALTKETILGEIDNIVQKAQELGIGKLYAVVTPRFKKLLKQAYVDLDTDNSEMIKNGYVGEYNNVTFIMSNHVHYTGEINSTSQIDYIPFLTKEACGYANPFAVVEAERIQGKFVDAVKGLTLFDGKIIYPKEVIVANVKYASASL